MSNRTHSFTLLVVDDDPNMLALLRHTIKQPFGDHIDIHSVTDSKMALAWIENNIVDILVTDLDMPDVNGLELLRHAKHKNPCCQVIFVTAHTTLNALIIALEGGATDYLLKPLDRAQLTELVADAQKRVRRWRHALAASVPRQGPVLNLR
jgi:DNA-binding NtrC family response regulator